MKTAATSTYRYVRYRTLLVYEVHQAIVVKSYDSKAPPLPLSADLSFHAVPALTLVLDLLFFSPPYAIASLPALALSGCIAFGYWFWIERCYQFNNFYPYPIFEMLDTPQRIG